MILTDVLVATDMNPNYYAFIPPFITAWKKILPDINIHIIVIAYDLIDELIPYKQYIKLFPPIPNINTGFIGQNIRLFYPALLTEAKGGIIITDMDMIPMSSVFYTEPIKYISDDKFFCYRPLSCVGPKEMVMCYNIAHQSVWKEIFNINSEADIVSRIKSIYQLPKYKNNGNCPNLFWTTDQLYLYEITQEWHKTTGNLIISNNDNIIVVSNKNWYINDTKFYRLWKFYPSDIQKYIKICSDFHMPRPYHVNKINIDYIISLL